MKSSTKNLVAFAGLASSLVLGSLAASATARAEMPQCSNATLHGQYGFYRTGHTATAALAAVGIIVFDGKGNSWASQSIAKNGNINFDVEFPGLYVIDANCTGRGFTSDGVEFVRFVVVDGGKVVYMLSESAGNEVFGVATRVATDR